MDSNLLHTSSEGLILENPEDEAPEYVYQRTNDPENAPDKPDYIKISFKNGDPIKIDDKEHSPANLLKRLNDFGRLHGIGRFDFS